MTILEQCAKSYRNGTTRSVDSYYDCVVVNGSKIVTVVDGIIREDDNRCIYISLQEADSEWWHNEHKIPSPQSLRAESNTKHIKYTFNGEDDAINYLQSIGDMYKCIIKVQFVSNTAKELFFFTTNGDYKHVITIYNFGNKHFGSTARKAAMLD